MEIGDARWYGWHIQKEGRGVTDLKWLRGPIMRAWEKYGPSDVLGSCGRIPCGQCVRQPLRNHSPAIPRCSESKSANVMEASLGWGGLGHSVMDRRTRSAGLWKETLVIVTNWWILRHPMVTEISSDLLLRSNKHTILSHVLNGFTIYSPFVTTSCLWSEGSTALEERTCHLSHHAGACCTLSRRFGLRFSIVCTWMLVQTDLSRCLRRNCGPGNERNRSTVTLGLVCKATKQRYMFSIWSQVWLDTTSLLLSPDPRLPVDDPRRHERSLQTKFLNSQPTNENGATLYRKDGLIRQCDSGFDCAFWLFVCRATLGLRGQ